MHTDQGPDGRDGRAFFGIDYHYYMPFSYWDSNPDIPLNPYLGDFYHSRPGIFDFEYFVNPYEYWYGTYELWIEYGQQGSPYGVAGTDGSDTYLMLICDPEGWTEDRFRAYSGKAIVQQAPGYFKVKVEEAGYAFEVEMYKSNVSARSSQSGTANEKEAGHPLTK